MESGGENHVACGKGGAGNGGLSWDIWELGGPRGAGALHHHAPQQIVPSAFFHPNNPTVHTISPSPSPSFSYHHAGAYSGDAHHLTSLKLGKRHYYEEGHASDPAAAAWRMKRERVATAVTMATLRAGAPPSLSAAATASSSSASGAAAAVPRCQVEGCNVALVDAKDYHRRHKVCEIHSKAPKVVVLGIEQRFCQQCSRFHVISEFDETKRSCRRRLAGHNERRRKSSVETIVRNPSPLDNTALVTGFPYISASNNPSRALSLLSPKVSSWVSPDLSSQSGAALRELIAENRAALLERQLFSDCGWHGTSPGAQAVLPCMPHHHPAPLDVSSQLADGWDHLRGPSSHVTLDLMQMPSSSFEFLSGRSRSKEDEEECCEIWQSLEGTHVV